MTDRRTEREVPNMVRALDSANIAHELSFEPAADGLVVLHVGEESYTIAPWELELALSAASGRLARPPWPSQLPESPETSPFDVVALATRRSEPVEIDTQASVQRMSQQQRANRALEAGHPAFDLTMSLVVPRVTATGAQVRGIAGVEVTVASLYWTAHLLRAASEQGAHARAASASSRFNGG